MPEALTAVVVGGSVGGLAAAHALLQAGLKVTVMERAALIKGSHTGAVNYCKNLLLQGLCETTFRKTRATVVTGPWA